MSNTEDKNAIVLENLENTIKNLNKKEFTMYFFVVDSRNTPNGSMEYIYRLAKTLQDKGYNIKMVYQLENEYTQEEIQALEDKNEIIDENRKFIGVTDWLGEEFKTLEHLNISTNEWKISPSDFLFIPEVFSSLMFQTFKHHITCKRYVILQNYNYVTEFIPLGVQWANYGISDVIVNTPYNEQQIKEVFPYVKTKLIQPCITNQFRKPLLEKKLIVNIITKKQSDVNRIIKPFYWKYPIYNFISFRDVRNFPKEQYSELLKEGAITIWVDTETPFGYSALEAMRCGNIVIGKVPENIPEWMGDENKLYDNGIWFYNINDVPDILAKVLGSWLQDEIPQVLIDNMEETNKKYTYEEWDKNVTETFEKIISERISELTSFYNTVKIKNKQTNK